MKPLIIYITVFLCSVAVAKGQSELSELEIQTEITALLGEEDADDFAERLAGLAERPVAVNSGDENEIARLFFLTEFQVKVLADHVKTKGSIVSVYEIALLPGFDGPTARLIAPFITLDVKDKMFLGGGATTALVTVMYKEGSSQLTSSGMRSVLRLRHSGTKLSYGFTAENDPGEAFTFKGAPGFDFLSAHIMYQGEGLVSRVIVGDYSLRFGEGLVFNNGGWLGGWLTSPSFMAGRAVVSPYTSSDENNFFRGAGIILGSLSVGGVIFISSNAIDGRVEYNPEDSLEYITTLVKGGLHNTESGLKVRNSLTESIAGIHLTAGNDDFRAGLTASATFFSLPLLPDTTTGVSLFKIRGDRLVNLGMDIKGGSGRFLFFGETAYSLPGSWAAIAGIREIPSDRVTINIIGRCLSPEYHTFHSSIFGAGSSAGNETGIACNIHIEAARYIFLSAGADICRYPWLRYRSSSPSTAFRTEVTGEYSPSEKFNYRLSWSISRREYDETGDTGVPETKEYIRQQMSMTAVYSHSSAIRLTSRAGWCRVKTTGESGWLLAQDILLTLKNIPVRFWGRYSLFTTGGFDSRLYAYENDMLHSFNIPALYGEGSRSYFMAEWNITGNIMLRVKYAVTMNEMENVRTSINEGRVQLKIVF